MVRQRVRSSFCIFDAYDSQLIQLPKGWLTDAFPWIILSSCETSTTSKPSLLVISPLGWWQSAEFRECCPKQPRRGGLQASNGKRSYCLQGFEAPHSLCSASWLHGPGVDLTWSYTCVTGDSYRFPNAWNQYAGCHCRVGIVVAQHPAVVRHSEPITWKIGLAMVGNLWR